MTANRTVAVVGAGVIGQVYAGCLADAGCAVWLLARGATCAQLRSDGIRLRRDGVESRPPVTVVDTVADIPEADVAFLAVRADQVADALPMMAAVRVPVVVTLVNLVDDTDTVMARLGADRVVLGFPGVGGVRAADGAIDYQRVRQQPTTLAAAGGRGRLVADDLRAAGLDVDIVPDLGGWLATHTVFIAGVGATLLRGGGAHGADIDRDATARMVEAIRDGFTSLSRRGVTVTPPPLRIIFTRVPRLFSVPYWQRQLRGELGTLTLAPHILATRRTEFPLIAAAARRLAPDARRLGAALDEAGYPAASARNEEGPHRAQADG